MVPESKCPIEFDDAEEAILHAVGTSPEECKAEFYRLCKGGIGHRSFGINMSNNVKFRLGHKLVEFERWCQRRWELWGEYGTSGESRMGA